ncbi:hypothetical protein ACKS0A_09788 [Histoplasma ohiense]
MSGPVNSSTVRRRIQNSGYGMRNWRLNRGLWQIFVSFRFFFFFFFFLAQCTIYYP